MYYSEALIQAFSELLDGFGCPRARAICSETSPTLKLSQVSKCTSQVHHTFSVTEHAEMRSDSPLVIQVILVAANIAMKYYKLHILISWDSLY